MKSLVRFMQRISQVSTTEALLMLIPVAVVAVVLWAYPWGRQIVGLVIVGVILAVLSLVGLAVWLKLKARKANDHT
jgi:uncharacterized membrane protein